MCTQVQSVHYVTENIADLTVYERSSDAFQLDNPNITIIRDTVVELNPHLRELYTSG